MPDRVSGLFAELLHVLEEGLRRGAIGVVRVGAELDLFLVVMLLGILAYVVFLTEAQRADDGEGHLSHLELGRHRREVALKGEIHQGGMDDVVLMMAKGYLRAVELLRQIEKLLAALPRAEKAGGLFATSNSTRSRNCGNGGSSGNGGSRRGT